MSDVREMLASRIDELAAQRSESNARLVRSAEALTRLAEYVRALPRSDPRLVALRALDDDPERFSFTEPNVALVIAAYGLRRRRVTGADLDWFLEELVRAAVTQGIGMVAD